MVQVGKRILLSLLLVLLSGTAALANNQRVRSLLVYVDIEKDGSATIYEKWDVATGNKITEWYLVRDNLGDITIDDFGVVADGQALEDIGEWDVDRSLKEKAGKCGIVHKRNGVELCWGIGSYGDHVYEVLYHMRGAVKSLQDYDILHLQLVSPGLSSPPEDVTVCIGSELVQMDTTNSRIWGFGYDGTCVFEDGGVVMKSDGAFDTEESVIALVRFDKGIFEPTSVRDQDFQEVLDKAMVGADFGDNLSEDDSDDDTKNGIIGLSVIVIGWIVWRRYKRLKKGNPNVASPLAKIKKENVAWYRDIPVEGNLPAAYELLQKAHDEDNSLRHLTSALILRMVYNGYLEVSRQVESENTDIHFTDKSTEELDTVSKGLYQMLKFAAGDNAILEKKEFSTWSGKHQSDVHTWAENVQKAGQAYNRDKGYFKNYDLLSESGAQEVVKLWGLRKFLSEFTLTEQREAFEAHLWKEYLVFGALLGIAKKVARQFKDIAPQQFKEMCESDSIDIISDYAFILADTFVKYDHYLNSLHSSSSSSHSSHSSSHGYGGRSSRGGGGGFSGGGRGGGGR